MRSREDFAQVRPGTRFVLLALVTLIAFLLPVSGALAGNFLATGHDADLHCSSGQDQCHYVATAVQFVRSGAPDPSRKILVLDNSSLEVGTALDDAASQGLTAAVPRDVVDPSSPAFASLPLDVNTYSAIVIASDASCGGCDLNANPSATSMTPDSDAINARSADIAAFFNAGGGLLYFAGASHGDGSSGNPQTYYSSVPIPVAGVPVQGPFSLTSAGMSLGFQDATNGIGTHDDINCCATHNSFSAPAAGSPIQVAETDNGAGAEETIFAGNVIIGAGGFTTNTPPGPPSAATSPPSAASTRSAVFSAVVNPNGAPTTAHFEYGLDTSYGSTTPEQAVGSDR